MASRPMQDAQHHQQAKTTAMSHQDNAAGQMARMKQHQRLVKSREAGPWQALGGTFRGADLGSRRPWQSWHDEFPVCHPWANSEACPLPLRRGGWSRAVCRGSGGGRVSGNSATVRPRLVLPLRPVFSREPTRARARPGGATVVPASPGSRTASRSARSACLLLLSLRIRDPDPRIPALRTPRSRATGVKVLSIW
ncbi:hypothetical protein LEMLEM_LOCUS11855 [Lemmus lemmus]